MSESSNDPEADAERAAIRAEGNGLPDGGIWPQKLDLAALAIRTPQKPKFIIADWLPCGYATLFAGHGGAGKSSIALYLAVCIALGIPFFGLSCERRRVMYLSCEDREDILHWRLVHICAYLGANLADLVGWFDVYDLVGRETILWAKDPKTGYTLTTAQAALLDRLDAQRTQVLMVDGISDTFGGNENSRPEVKAFVNTLLHVLPIDGALLLLGHVPKPTAGGLATTEGYSGSTQWHNAVRARWYLRAETENGDNGGRPERTGKLVMELQKSNLGRMDQSLEFAWDDEVRLFVSTGATGQPSRIDRAHRDQTEQDGIRSALLGCANSEPPIIVPAAHQGPRTAFNVLKVRPEFPESLKANPRRFWAHIEVLRQIHHLDEAGYSRADRKAGVQFVLTSEGRG